MKIEFDPAKSEKNAKERGLSFSLMKEFDWDSAVFSEDARFAYDETRYIALGFIGDRLHAVCFTGILGGVRIISFRKANQREIRRYEKEKAADR